MTWTLETSRGFESDKIAAIATHHLQGRGLDIGCGMRKVWPGLIGVDNGHHFGKGGADISSVAHDLSMFSNGSMDCIFSSHLLEHVPPTMLNKTLSEWTRVLKVGGKLVLYLPSANLYPKMGEKGANPDHKWDIYPGDVERELQDWTHCGWTQLEKEERSENDEYSLYLVFQKRDDGEWVENIWERNPGGRKRALVIRYGAIGDQLIAASILPHLKEQGFHVTYNTTPGTAVVVENDPNIDEFFLQEKDFVPNEHLGPYWQSLSARYDRVINLCESIEGALLQMPGRMGHTYSDESRRRLFGSQNYLERTHDIAAVPHDFRQYFFPTEPESRQAAARVRAAHAPVIAWAITGSSLHKTYPYTNTVIGSVLKKTDAHFYLLGHGDDTLELENAVLECLLRDGLDVSRVHGMTNKWSIRESLSFAQKAAVVVGPETGILNGVAMEKNQKVIYLSHSSDENLTKHWVNTISLTPDERAACYPCHRMHFTWDFCNQIPQTMAAACASAISPTRVADAIMMALEDAGVITSMVE